MKRLVDSANLLIDIDINNAGQPPYGAASGLPNQYSLETNAEQWNILRIKRLFKMLNFVTYFRIIAIETNSFSKSSPKWCPLRHKIISTSLLMFQGETPFS